MPDGPAVGERELGATVLDFGMPSGSVAMPRLTLEQFNTQPDTKPASEYVCGRVYQKPMPRTEHAAIQLYFGVILFPFLARTGLGRALSELRCIFGPPGNQRTYVPDMCVVAQMPREPYLYRAPDLAIEILSPDHHRALFLDKIQFYLLNGVRLIWIVDPETRTIAVEAPATEGQVLGEGDMLDGGDVLPGFGVAVDDIFAQMDR